MYGVIDTSSSIEKELLLNTQTHMISKCNKDYNRICDLVCINIYIICSICDFSDASQALSWHMSVLSRPSLILSIPSRGTKQHLVLLPPAEGQTEGSLAGSFHILFICRCYREAVLTQNCVNPLVCDEGWTGPCTGLGISLKYWEYFLYRQQKVI